MRVSRNQLAHIAQYRHKYFSPDELNGFRNGITRKQLKAYQLTRPLAIINCGIEFVLYLDQLIRYAVAATIRRRQLRRR